MRTLKLWPPIPSTIFDSTLSITGKCPSSSAAGETSPPVGSVYVASTDKYYSWEYSKWQWDKAQVECSAKGATLIEANTLKEHNKVLNKIMTSKKNYALGITSVDIEIRGLLQTPSMRIIGLALSTPT